MTFPQYILTDDEITTINANFLIIGNAVADLYEVINEPLVGTATIKHRAITDIARIDLALNNLRPLITHLYELQGKENK